MTESRFAVQMRSDLRTPYAKVQNQLVPRPTVVAAAEVCGTYPPPILATYMELGRKDASLVGVVLPLVY